MPKQIFQRPPQVPLNRNTKINSGPPGQPDFGRKSGKGKKPAKVVKPAKT